MIERREGCKGKSRVMGTQVLGIEGMEKQMRQEGGTQNEGNCKRGKKQMVGTWREGHSK